MAGHSAVALTRPRTIHVMWRAATFTSARSPGLPVQAQRHRDEGREDDRRQSEKCCPDEARQEVMKVGMHDEVSLRELEYTELGPSKLRISEQLPSTAPH
jgi:hypothetical protein